MNVYEDRDLRYRISWSLLVGMLGFSEHPTFLIWYRRLWVKDADSCIRTRKTACYTPPLRCDMCFAEVGDPEMRRYRMVVQRHHVGGNVPLVIRLPFWEFIKTGRGEETDHSHRRIPCQCAAASLIHRSGSLLDLGSKMCRMTMELNSNIQTEFVVKYRAWGRHSLRFITSC
jgi:hypothetical protein